MERGLCFFCCRSHERIPRSDLSHEKTGSTVSFAHRVKFRITDAGYLGRLPGGAPDHSSISSVVNTTTLSATNHVVHISLHSIGSEHVEGYIIPSPSFSPTLLYYYFSRVLYPGYANHKCTRLRDLVFLLVADLIIVPQIVKTRRRLQPTSETKERR